MGSEGLHEPENLLDSGTVDYHRAMTSLCEELEAVDWYNQRATATNDTTLREVLEHNRDEEKEHAVMLLEWLRRHDNALDRNLRKYLYSTGSLIALEQAATPSSNADVSNGSLAIGGLREVRR